MTPGATTAISNSQCAISSFSYGTVGATVAFNVNITFKPAFTGNKLVYLGTTADGWHPLGVWVVPGGTTTGPAIGAMSPARGSTPAAQSYSFNFSDTNGLADFSVLDILINSAIDGRSACYLAYVPSTGNPANGSLYGQRRGRRWWAVCRVDERSRIGNYPE